ncbi:MAG: TetR/AcrR family transcriptional regulator [Verrucomicrobiota bacterium]|jgi:AcrR family transcriptional regulator
MNRRNKTAPPPAAARQVRRRIIAGARRHFFANGFRHVTMDDLAGELGMSKKTLYAHFPGKNDLLKSVLMNKFDDADADLARITAGSSGDVRAALRQLLARAQRQMDEIQPHFIRDLRRAAPEMFQLVEARRRDIIRRHFGKLFAEGRKAGLIRNDIPAGFMIEILLGAVQAVINPPKMAELGLTPNTAFPAILKVVLNGVIVRKGKSHL